MSDLILNDESAEQQLPTALKPLTGKEKLWFLAYVGVCKFNATKAAKIAGYKCSNENGFACIGYQNSRKLHILEHIEAFFAEHLMSAEECLSRLTEIASVSIDDVISDKGSWFDLEKARENGSIHFVKKLKSKRITKQVKRKVETHPDLNSDETEEIDENIETSIISEEVEWEMYDAHAAIRDIGRHHKLFTDNHHLSGELEYVTFDIDTAGTN